METKDRIKIQKDIHRILLNYAKKNNLEMSIDRMKLGQYNVSWNDKVGLALDIELGIWRDDDQCKFIRK